ncbi:MAG TPA: hypothetical protein VFV34_20305 [Blastocatellia bacterium]|nr:hypothetical protein [Blastocatellia bacterium]
MTARIMAAAFVTTSLIVAQTGCGKPFNVKRKVDLPFSAQKAQQQVGDVTVQADAIRDENLIHDTFDANLIMADVLPVQLRIENHNASPLSVKGFKLELQDESGHDRKRLSARATFKRLVSYYEMTTYNKYGYKRSQEDLVSYEFDWDEPIGAGAGRSGLLFFQITPEDRRAHLVLLLRFRGPDKLEQTARLELRSNGG